MGEKNAAAVKAASVNPADAPDGATKIDSATLAQVVDLCFDLSMNGNVDADDQARFLAAGKRLRGYLINLISARFTAGTPQLLQANQQIASVNASLESEQSALESIASTLATLATLTAILDGLLQVAAKFI